MKLFLVAALVLSPLATRATNSTCRQEDSKDDCRSIEGCFLLYGGRPCVPEDEIDCQDIPRRGNGRDLDGCEWRDDMCVDRTPAESPTVPPSSVLPFPSPSPAPNCRGECTFAFAATIDRSERGVSVRLSRRTSATGQCRSKFRGIAIERPKARRNTGAGRMRFKVAKCPNTQTRRSGTKGNSLSPQDRV